jgi:hypothetical protein
MPGWFTADRIRPTFPLRPLRPTVRHVRPRVMVPAELPHFSVLGWFAPTGPICPGPFGAFLPRAPPGLYPDLYRSSRSSQAGAPVRGLRSMRDDWPEDRMGRCS